jgi:O-glycosyl hydrolase
MTSRCRGVIFACGLLALVWCSAEGVRAAITISADGAQRFQTIDGFGVNVNSASWNAGELRPALDMLVDQLGATIFRVIIDNADWEATNDNSDPNAFNWTYYNTVYTSPKLEELWGTISYLNQKGINSGLMLNIMGPTASWMGGSHINTTAEDEWVEMVVSLVYYGRVTRGLQIGLFAPMNEPDWDGIEGPNVDQWQYARLMRKLSQKLDAVGLSSVRLVGPDTAQIGTGVTGYMPELMRDSVAMSKIDHFGFHNYAGDSGGADAAIKSSAYPGKNFWITEVTNIWDILAHLSQGPSAIMVWDAYDSVYNHAILAGRGTTPPNDVGNGPPLVAYNTSTRVYTPRKGFYECAQLFKFVQPGSQRVRATTSSSSLTLYAFHHGTTGQFTVVGRSTSTSSQVLTGTLQNLQGVTSLKFYQTTGSQNLQPGADVPVNAGSFSATIAANAVFTLTSGGVASTPPPAPPTNLKIIR